MQDFESRQSLSKPDLTMSMNKASETIQPALANSIDDFLILNQFDTHLIQTVLKIMTFTFTCYLLFRLALCLLTT